MLMLKIHDGIRKISKTVKLDIKRILVFWIIVCCKCKMYKRGSHSYVTKPRRSDITLT